MTNHRIFFAVLLLLGPFLVTASTTHAASSVQGLIANDKVRLISAVVDPDRLIFGEGNATLAGAICVRLVDGLEAQEASSQQALSTRFVAAVTWEILGDDGAVLATRTGIQEIAMPFTRTQLPADPTLPVTATGVPFQTFLQVSALASFDGKDAAGNFILAGVRHYRAFATVTRIKVLNKKTETLVIGQSPDLSGSLLVSPRPAPPSVDLVPPVTNVPLLVLTGQKPEFTSLIVSGVERVPLSAATSWVTTKLLIEGGNTLVFSDKNSFGIESTSVTVAVTLASEPPPPPSVSATPEVTSSRTVTISGTKAPGTAIVIDGVVVVPPDDQTTWSVTVTLAEEGENHFLVQAQDSAGNRSLSAGSQVAGVAHEKPVIGDLEVVPSEVPAGQPVVVKYRLFAQVPPAENAALKVNVTVQDGDLVVRQLFSGVQDGDPTGLPYSVAWDGTEAATGQPVIPNTSFRIVVSAERSNPTTIPPERANANTKETAVVVTGSAHTTSKDGKLELVFRPDGAKVEIRSFPLLSVPAGQSLTARGLKPIGGCYEITSDRPLSGPAVGILRYPGPDGHLLRPFCFDETQLDWLPVGRCNWNPGTLKLSFALPRPCTLVLAATTDIAMPYLTQPTFPGGRFEVRARDDGSGINTTKTRLRQQGTDLTARLGTRMPNGVHELALTLEAYDASRGTLELYLEDWVGNGRLFLLGGN